MIAFSFLMAEGYSLYTIILRNLCWASIGCGPIGYWRRDPRVDIYIHCVDGNTKSPQCHDNVTNTLPFVVCYFVMEHAYKHIYRWIKYIYKHGLAWWWEYVPGKIKQSGMHATDPTRATNLSSPDGPTPKLTIAHTTATMERVKFLIHFHFSDRRPLWYPKRPCLP